MPASSSKHPPYAGLIHSSCKKHPANVSRTSRRSLFITAVHPVTGSRLFSCSLFLFLFLHRHHKTALLICADEFVSFFHHVASAFRTFLSGRFLPGHEITVRVGLTAVILSAFFRLLDDDFFSALRTRDAGLLQIRLRIPGTPGIPDMRGTYREDRT